MCRANAPQRAVAGRRIFMARYGAKELRAKKQGGKRGRVLNPALMK